MTTLSPPGLARPTMVDVAREAEVSLKTVSRVVNGEAGVRPETARKVHRVIERLGFQRNDSASQLRRGTSASIGLVVEDLSNPFYSQLAAAVEREAGREGHLLITASAEGDPQRETALVAALMARRVDGLVVEGAGHVAQADPVALVDGPAAIDSLVDEAGSAKEAFDAPGPLLERLGARIAREHLGGAR